MHKQNLDYCMYIKTTSNLYFICDRLEPIQEIYIANITLVSSFKGFAQLYLNPKSCDLSCIRHGQITGQNLQKEMVQHCWLFGENFSPLLASLDIPTEKSSLMCCPFVCINTTSRLNRQILKHMILTKHSDAMKNHMTTTLHS